MAEKYFYNALWHFFKTYINTEHILKTKLKLTRKKNIKIFSSLNNHLTLSKIKKKTERNLRN